VKSRHTFGYIPTKNGEAANLGGGLRYSFAPIPIVTVSGACFASANPYICRPASKKHFWISVARPGEWCKSVTTRKIPGAAQERIPPSGYGFSSKPPASPKIFVSSSPICGASPFVIPGAMCTTPLCGDFLRQVTRLLCSLVVIFLGPSILFK
jgi:hypothetical protein